MPDYQNGKIYTIRCRSDNNLIYVGSTTQPLAKRWGGHKKRGNDVKYQNMMLYKTINNNWLPWYIELYEEYPCENKEQLCRREGQIIREIGTLNSEIAGRTAKEWREENPDKIREQYKIYRENNFEKIKLTKKEYYENNADKIKEQTKLYRENNKDKITEYEKTRIRDDDHYKKLKEKITCECGCILRKNGLPRHLKSKKHIELLNPV
jgi:hypothetical protein